MPTDPQTFALYRFYGAGGTLLYIGITGELPRRLGQHNGDKEWWAGVARVEVEHFPTKAAVREAEKRAIVAEKPLYNGVHNDEGAAWRIDTARPKRPADRLTREREMEIWAAGKAAGMAKVARSVLEMAEAGDLVEVMKDARDDLDDGAKRADDDPELLAEAASRLTWLLHGRVEGLEHAGMAVLTALPLAIRDEIVADADRQVAENDPTADPATYRRWRVFKASYFLRDEIFHTGPPVNPNDPWGPAEGEQEVPF